MIEKDTFSVFILFQKHTRIQRIFKGQRSTSALSFSQKRMIISDRSVGHREDLERERTDDEFMAMYEQYEVFDALEDEFLEKEEEYTALVASYVDEHLDLFAKIIK